MRTERDRAVFDFAERYWERLLEIDPLLGTEVGDERYDDRLPDPSEQGLEIMRAGHAGALDEARALSGNGLSEEARTTLAFAEAVALRHLDYVRYRIDRFFAVKHLWGAASLLADTGTTQRADTPERLERYVARLSAFPSYFEAVAEVLREAAAEGQTQPALVVDRTIAQVERLLGGDPEDSPGMTPVPAGDAAGRARVAGVLRERVWPGYQRYLEGLRAYRPSARDTIGLHALPTGDEIYASQIRVYTTLPLEPQRVHDLGLEDLARIQAERHEIARALGRDDPNEAMAEYTRTGRNTAASREQMLELVRGQVERSWEAAPRFFGRLPKANCDVRPVEEFREDDMPGAYYQPPSHDNARPGVYFVNTSHLDARPLHQVATTTYHEANPGHHFQLSMEHEFTERPRLRRFGGGMAGSAFVEGWGLYSERLAGEMGLFENDYERMGMLEAQAWRAVRLIVDSGIHALGWDRKRAIAKMEEAGVARKDAEIEVDRYIAWPGQALAYKIGHLEIEKWRARSEKRLGAEFSLPDFHDRLLALGSLPLAAIEAEIERDAGGPR